MTIFGDSDSSDELKTSMTLVRDAQAFDTDAWFRLVSVYTPLIRLWCITKGVRGHDIGDCCQEVFLRVSQRLPFFVKNSPTDSFRGWLRRITHIVIADGQRKKYKGFQIAPGGSTAAKVFKDLPAPSQDSSLGSQILQNERQLLAQRVMRVIRRDFSALQTKAFMNVVMHQRKPREVAEDLNTSVNYVYKARCCILAKIRRLFPNAA